MYVSIQESFQPVNEGTEPTMNERKSVQIAAKIKEPPEAANVVPIVNPSTIEPKSNTNVKTSIRQQVGPEASIAPIAPSLDPLALALARLRPPDHFVGEYGSILVTLVPVLDGLCPKYGILGTTSSCEPSCELDLLLVIISVATSLPYCSAS